MRRMKGFSLIDETCSRKHVLHFASELYIPKCDERNGRLWIQRVTIHLDGNSKVKGKTAFLKRRERGGKALHCILTIHEDKERKRYLYSSCVDNSRKDTRDSFPSFSPFINSISRREMSWLSTEPYWPHASVPIFVSAKNCARIREVEEHKSGVKGVEKRDTRFLFSEIRSAPRPHLKANSTRATLLFEEQWKC